MRQPNCTSAFVTVRQATLYHIPVDAFYEELTAKHPEIDRIPEEKVGDHDYIFEWAFCEDGAIRSAVGASGIEQVKGVKSRTVGDDTDRHDTAYGHMVGEHVTAVNHDHFFNFRLDVDVAGPLNSLQKDPSLREHS